MLLILLYVINDSCTLYDFPLILHLLGMPRYYFLLLLLSNYFPSVVVSQHKKATIHQLTSMLCTSKMSYFQVITTC